MTSRIVLWFSFISIALHGCTSSHLIDVGGDERQKMYSEPIESIQTADSTMYTFLHPPTISDSTIVGDIIDYNATPPSLSRISIPLSSVAQVRVEETDFWGGLSMITVLFLGTSAVILLVGGAIVALGS